ncbi:transglutaminase domain-containing protein [Paenibacillus sp. GXUN7292]|uniref:transglutaminase domain-containing protein n=1 Tax=Paenibacillus sp. GXUN7292 TaxID=3422499 RepID=UPI003D7D6976
MKGKFMRLLWIGLIIFGVYYVNTLVKKASDPADVNEAAILQSDSQTDGKGHDDSSETASAEQSGKQDDQYVLESMDEKLEKNNPAVDEEYAELEKKIRKAFLNREEQFTITYYGNSSKLSNNLQNLVDTALAADDYTAYILSSYRINTKSWGDKNTINIDAAYRESFEQTELVNRSAKDILAKIIHKGMNDHEKVLAIHDWIVDNVEYDESLTYYTAYDALTRGTTVCQGYSLITYRLLSEAGIENMITEGEVDTGLHSWNLVKLDGNWYHLDVTWDDPTNIEGGTYDYYLVTDKQLRKDHTWTKTYPSADTNYSEQLNLLIASKQPKDGDQGKAAAEIAKFTAIREQIGLHWYDDEHTVSTVDEMSQLFHRTIKANAKEVTFRYDASTGIKDALKKSMEALNRTISYKATFSEMKDGSSQLVTVQLDY